MTTSFRHDRISLYLKLVSYAILAVTVLHQKIRATNGGIFLEQEYDTIDLRQLFEIVRRNLLLIVAVTILFAAGGYLGTTFLITPQYEASAMLIVNSREGQQLQGSVTNDSLNSAKQLVETYSVILKSDTVLDQTIEDLNLPLTYDQLAAKVSITAVNDTQVMKITVQDADANLAKDIVSNIVEQAPEVIINTVKAGSVEVVSDASANPDPVSPSKSRNTALAGILGCILVVGILFMKSLFNNRIMTEADISQKLALPILGVIPDSALGDNGSRKKKRRA